MGSGRGVVRRKLDLSGAAGHHADPDVARAAGSGLFLRHGLNANVGRRRLARLFHRCRALRHCRGGTGAESIGRALPEGHIRSDLCDLFS
jgi:hypothetical protein